MSSFEKLFAIGHQDFVILHFATFSFEAAWKIRSAPVRQHRLWIPEMKFVQLWWACSYPFVICWSKMFFLIPSISWHWNKYSFIYQKKCHSLMSIKITPLIGIPCIIVILKKTYSKDNSQRKILRNFCLNFFLFFSFQRPCELSLFSSK